MLDGLQLRNFKAFKTLDLPIAPLTLLTGINATGKSTIMQALALLRQSFIEGVLQDRGLLLNGEFVQLGTGQDVLHEDYESGDAGPTIEIGFTNGGQASLYGVGYVADADVLEFIRPPDEPAHGVGLFEAGFQYLKADRLGPAAYYPRSLQAATKEGSLGPLGQHTPNYLREHSEREVVQTSMRHPDARSHGLLDEVDAWMQDICPGVNLGAHALGGTDLVALDYGFFGRAGVSASNRYRATNVGFGLSYVLPIIVALVTAEADRLILIENPEAHLHPRGQVAMGLLAARASAVGACVLVESHSDHFLNGLRLGVARDICPAESVALYFLSRERAGQVHIASPEMNSQGMLSDWPTGFFDESALALAELLS